MVKYFALVLLMLSTQCPAAVPELDVAVGFGDRFRAGTVTPVSVTVTSAESRTEGELVLVFTAGTALERGTTYTVRRAIRLNAGVPAVFRYALPLEVSSYPLEVRLNQGLLTAATAEVDLRPLNTDRPLVVGLSRRPSLDSVLPVLGDRAGRPVELSYPRFEYLPEDAAAWAGTELVIWHDLPPDALDDRSADALALQIASGGSLIVIPGPWSVGRSYPSALDLGRVAVPTIGPDGTVLYPLLDPGETAPPESDETIVSPVFQRLGRGSVIYLPFDPLSAPPESPPRRMFESALAEVPLGVRQPLPTRLVDGVTEAFFHLPGPLLPPVGRPLAVVGTFGIAAAGLLLFGRRSTSTRFRWVQVLSILVLAGAASGAVVFGLVAESEVPVQRRLELTVVDGAGPPILVERIRLFSPNTRSVDVPLPPTGIVAWRDGEDLTIRIDGEGRRLEAVGLEAWQTRDVEVFRSFGVEDVNSPPWTDALRIRADQVRPLPNPGVSTDDPPESDWPDGFARRVAEILRPGEQIDLARRAGSNVAILLDLGASP